MNTTSNALPDLLWGPRLESVPSHILSPFGFRYTHQNRIQAFFDSAKEELKMYFGDYTYEIWENRHPKTRHEKYEVHAKYLHHGEWHCFVDGVGRTPREALLSVNQMRAFMRQIGLLN